MSTDDRAMAAAVVRKARESAEAQAKFFDAHADAIARCANDVAAALGKGGRLFTFGNGGSACDAEHVAVEFMHPVIEKRAAFPSIALPTQGALLTAVGNDQDFSLAFAQQLRMLAKPGDVALGLSTSGKSSSVNRALTAARELGMLVVGFSGRDGGKMPSLCDHCFTVPSFSIHRIQEAHVTLLHVLWDLVHIARGEEDVL